MEKKKSAALEVQVQELHNAETTGRARFEVRISRTKSELFLDGIPLKNIRAYTIHHHVGGAPTISLEFTAPDLSFESDFVPPLPEPWCAFYEPIYRDSGNASANEQE
jgi:hypothetical protein